MGLNNLHSHGFFILLAENYKQNLHKRGWLIFKKINLVFDTGKGSIRIFIKERRKK